MSFRSKPRWSMVPGLVVLFAIARQSPLQAAPAGDLSTDPAELLLLSLHPDSAAYVESVRPLPQSADGSVAPVYMALVRPGAVDPTAPASAPFAGPGARNDILYDPGILAAGRSAGWTLLLLDHEYFHARHLAGATTLPLPRRTGAEVEHHYCEAAAWGYTVEQARAGRYPGLRPDEFREALDRYGDHYRALRSIAQGSEAWSSLEAPLLQPAAFVRTLPSSPAGALSHPSGSGR
jgi:hypothetical protein